MQPHFAQSYMPACAGQRDSKRVPGIETTAGPDSARDKLSGGARLAGTGGVYRCWSTDSINLGQLTCQHPKKDSAAANVCIVDAGGPKNSVD